MMTVQTAVYVAGPYFNPFMLRELQLSYIAYVGLAARRARRVPQVRTRP